MLHNDPTSGHLGITRTLKRLKDRFYWVNFTETVEEWIKTCVKCQRRKNIQRKPHGVMKQYLVGAPLERVALDILGPLPESHEKNKYILVISDYFTKWVESFAIPNQEAITITQVFVEQFICRFGLPRQVHTDQGRQAVACEA